MASSQVAPMVAPESVEQTLPLPSVEEWMAGLKTMTLSRVEMNNLIMNYLESEGYKEAAEKFKAEAGVSSTVLSESFDRRIPIQDAIRSGNIQEAITLINDMHPELLDDNSHLYFHLQQQYLIELIRTKNLDASLEFSQAFMSEKGEEHPELLPELEKTMSLLAFRDPESSVFGDLLHQSHREMVAKMVNASILESESQEPNSKLALLMKLLVWSQSELDRRKIIYPKLCSDLTFPIVVPAKAPVPSNAVVVSGTVSVTAHGTAATPGGDGEDRQEPL